MGCSTRVLNISKCKHIKRSQARGRVEQCLSVWVDEGYSIRDLTMAESFQARAQQAKDKMPIPPPEIRHVIYTLSTPDSRLLAKEARHFDAEVSGYEIKPTFRDMVRAAYIAAKTEVA